MYKCSLALAIMLVMFSVSSYAETTRIVDFRSTDGNFQLYAPEDLGFFNVVSVKRLKGSKPFNHDRSGTFIDIWYRRK